MKGTQMLIADRLLTLRLDNLSAEDLHFIYAAEDLNHGRKQVLASLAFQHAQATTPSSKSDLEDLFYAAVVEAINELRQD